MRRRIRSPLEIRRLSYALMILAAVLGGWSGASRSPIGMIAVMILAIATAGCYLRATDVLLDFDYRSVRRQTAYLTIAGIACSLLGCVLASQLVGDRSPALLRVVGYAAIGGGIAAGLSGVIALLWSFAGTYAGEQIEKRSQEEW